LKANGSEKKGADRGRQGNNFPPRPEALESSRPKEELIGQGMLLAIHFGDLMGLP